MNKDIDTLNKAMHKLYKSQNFINGDGRDNQDSIHTNPLNNENGSISSTRTPTGGTDPVDSSDSRKKNPLGHKSHSVNAQGTKTNRPQDPRDPVNTSGDGHADDAENKSQTGETPKDMTKDKNGVRQPHTELHNGTRKLSDNPRGNAQAEDSALNHSSGTKHNDAELKSVEGLMKDLIHAEFTNVGAINQMQRQHSTDMKNIKNYMTKHLQEINGKGTAKNTESKSEEMDDIAGVHNDEAKHMTNAQVSGMFGHADHEKGKKGTKARAQAINAVTRCHNSHKSMDPSEWNSIVNEAVQAGNIATAKSVLSHFNDDATKSLAKSLDSKLEHDAETGNKQALGHDNYEYDKRERDQKAHKSVKTSTADKSTTKAASHDSLANLNSIAASAKEAGNDSMVASCDSACRKLSAAKSEAANVIKNVNNVDHNSSANISNLSANSKQKPDNRSDDINNSTKSEASNAQKSMPQGRAVNATPTDAQKKDMQQQQKTETVNKSIQPSITDYDPSVVKRRANVFSKEFSAKSMNPMVQRAVSLAKDAAQTGDPKTLNKSLSTYWNAIH